jgi:hypothetical protein
MNAKHTSAATFLKVLQTAESQLHQPIFEQVGRSGKDKKLVGDLIVSIEWSSYFENVLMDGTVELVLKHICNELDDVVSYRINGPKATFLGFEDLHDPKFDSLMVSVPFLLLDHGENVLPSKMCPPQLSIELYPTQDLEDSFHTSRKYFYPSAIVLIFGFTTLVFALYD